MSDRLEPPRPRRSPADLGLVAAGGAIGTGLRYGLGSAVPHWSGVAVGTWGINVVGAFALGLLLTVLVDEGPNAGRARRLRLGLGTGLLGGFTTYSALATDTMLLAGTRPELAVGYALTTVLVGGLAALAGIRCGRAWWPRATPTGEGR